MLHTQEIWLLLRPTPLGVDYVLPSVTPNLLIRNVVVSCNFMDDGMTWSPKYLPLDSILDFVILDTGSHFRNVIPFLAKYRNLDWWINYTGYSSTRASSLEPRARDIPAFWFSFSLPGIFRESNPIYSNFNIQNFIFQTSSPWGMFLHFSHELGTDRFESYIGQSTMLNHNLQIRLPRHYPYLG